MARFIVDVANIDGSDSEVKAICEVICDALNNMESSSGVITAICIDRTNDNQFYTEFDNGQTNELSKKQIKEFKRVCNQ